VTKRNKETLVKGLNIVVFMKQQRQNSYPGL